MSGRGRVIAIDGPAASGKSTTARRVADRIGYCHLNSGLLYRAVTWMAIRHGWDEEAPDFDAHVGRLDVELVGGAPALEVRVAGEDPGAALHAPEVSARVSAVAARGAVRDKALAILRRARERFDLVCDGRDIGTVVFPDAELTVFLVASAEERARRRLLDHGVEPTPERVREESERLRARDRADSRRELSPLRRAAGAVEIDTTRRSPAEVVDRIVDLAAERGLVGDDGKR